MKRQKGKERSLEKGGVMAFCSRTKYLHSEYQNWPRQQIPLLKYTLEHEATTKVSPLIRLCHEIKLEVISPRYTLESLGEVESYADALELPLGF